MERRDIIKDEIERIGRVLGKVLAMLIGTKASGNVSQSLEQAEQVLQTELDIDINKLLQLSNEDLISWLADDLKLSDDSIEQLADIIFELGLKKQARIGSAQKVYLIKSLTLYEHLTNTGSMYSLGWMEKENRLRRLIDSN